MSEALVCDICGEVRARLDAPRRGWIEVRALGNLSAVVPEDHPLHRSRHLCGLDCLARFARVAVAGMPIQPQLPLGMDRREAAWPGLTPIREVAGLHEAPAVEAANVEDPQQLDGPGGRTRRQRRAGGAAGGRPARTPIAAGADGDPAGRPRLAEAILARTTRDDVDAISLSTVAERPRPKRRAG